MIRAGLAVLLFTLPAAAQQGGTGASCPPPAPLAEDVMRLVLVDYPRSARRAHIEGDVKLSMCVSAKGRATDVKLLESSGNAALDEASVKGMAKLRFIPAKDAACKAIDWCDPPHVLTIKWRLPK